MTLFEPRAPDFQNLFSFFFLSQCFQIHNFETVAQILSRWCDKDCDIFNVLCTVLWVFIQNPSMNKVRFAEELLFGPISNHFFRISGHSRFHGDSRSPLLAARNEEIGGTQGTHANQYFSVLDAGVDAKRKTPAANARDEFRCQYDEQKLYFQFVRFCI